jgi:hypothetical protein
MNASPRSRLLFALFCSLPVLGGTFWLVLHLDSFVEWNWATSRGQYSEAENITLSVAAVKYAEEGKPGKVCVEKWLGRDDCYLYLALGCAAFRTHLGEVEVDGDPNYLPTRLRVHGSEVGDLEQPSAPSFANGLRRLFPQIAAMRFRQAANYAEYRQRGLERMEIRGFSTLRP